MIFDFLIAMNDTPHEFDDDLLPWLDAAREDAVEPRAGRLDALGSETRKAFVAASRVASAEDDGTASDLSPAKRPETDRSSRSSSGATPMTWIFRALAVAAAIGCVALFGWMLQPEQVQGFPLGDAFERLREARSLKLEFSEKEADGDGTLWVQAPGQMRKEYSDTRYDVVQGSRLWRVDETKDSVEETNSPYFDDRTRELDLFALLDLADVDEEAIETLRPEAAVEYAGENCFRYSMRIARPEGDLRMVAYAAIDSKELKSLLFFPFDQKPNAEVVPLREFHLVAVNQAPPANAFAAQVDLRSDGGLATIVESFGVVTLRPLDQRRWTPICRETRLFAGDWLRAELRGAHAAIVRMNSGARVTLGPGAMVEFLDENRIRVHAGEAVLEAVDDLKKPLVAIGPKEGSFELAKTGSLFLQVRAQDTLTRRETSPKWLEGLNSTSVGNSLGSLLVEVDGRNVPLTIGEHTVKVTIKDQIARTVIEETFVNETDSELEGVFTFPLPADASISGFAMWVGNEKKEADIVEKQRARQIYETILHEKRDPGLLEWTAGNVFQARVYPIPANSSKRVSITYTQVLPMRAGAYRYRYALMSDLLRRHPLDKLLIHVDAQSAMPLAKVHSPTHAMRIDQNRTTVTAEFAAQEHVPTSDFEMVFETSGMRPEVTMIPHRRGSDGYFLLQLTPPTEGIWQRAVLRDGDPLKILLLCDTSASMDDAQRDRQKQIVQATLAALGPEDRFLLATTDVDTLVDGDWKAPNEEARDAAIARLDSRLSFGWTDLAKAVETIAPYCDESTHVLYLGDGIVTVGDATPEPALAEIDRIAKERALGTFHAMALGSTYEARLLKRLSQIGGGTYRALNTDDDSAQVVQEWLAQIASPGLTDIQLAFEGIRTAAVYPDELPRLPEGMQHIVVGRYQPEDGNVSGRAIVTGKLRGEEARYVANVELMTGSGELDGTEDDMSFIPRLWAKARIDHLLSQSVDGQAKEEVIGLSEEFTLMTPYTSLLVLDSESDYERFNVKRRVKMSDGERFFQTAEDKARIEQRQKLLAGAKRYRQGLRMQALAALAQMGRGIPPTFAALQQAQIYDRRSGREDLVRVLSSTSGTDWFYRDGAMLGRPMSGPVAWDASSMLGAMRGGMPMAPMPLGGPMGQTAYYDEYGVALDRLADEKSAFFGDYEESAPFGGSELAKSLESDYDRPVIHDPQPVEFDAWGTIGGKPRSNELYAGTEMAGVNGRMFRSVQDAAYLYDVDGTYGGFGGGWGEYGGERFGLATAAKAKYAQPHYAGLSVRFAYSDFMANRPASPAAIFSPFGRGRGYYYEQPYVESFPEIFPSLGSASTAPARELPLPANWTPEAVRLADRLVQRDDLDEETRLRLHSETVSHDPRWERIVDTRETDALLASAKWAVLTDGPGRSFAHVDLVAEGKRRVAWPHRGTGRVRDAAKHEAFPSIDPFGHGIERPLYRSHGEYEAKVLSDDGETATLELLWSDWKSHLTIDLERNVVTRIETFRTDLKDDNGQPEKSSEVRFEDFVSAGGLTIPRKRIDFDDQGRVTSETTQSLEELSGDDYDEALAGATEFADEVLWLPVDLPTFLVAKAHEKEGSSRLEDAWVLFTTEVGRQGWDAAGKALARVKQLAGEKFALEEIEFHFDRLARHGEKALATATGKVEELIAKPHDDELPRLDIWRDTVASGVSSARWLEIVDSLKAFYERQELPEHGILAWMHLRIWALESVGRRDDATELMGERARLMPWDYSEQTQYARRLHQEERTAEALAFLRGLLDDESKPYDGGEKDQFRSTIADFLEQDRRYGELVEFLQDWMKLDDRGESVYSRLLWALLAVDRQDEAEELVAKWIDRALQPEKLSSGDDARARAAIRYRLGYVHNISRHAMTVPMARDILELGKKLLAFPDRWELATMLFSYSAFDGMEPSRELRREFGKTLLAKYREVTPEQVQILRNYVIHADDEEIEKFRRDLAAFWEKERAKAEGDRRNQLTELLWELYAASPFSWQERVEWCRKIVAEGGDLRDQYQDRLVDLLLDPPNDLLEEMLPAGLREIAKLGQSLTPAERKILQLAKLETAAASFPDKLFGPKRREIERHAEEAPQDRAEHAKNLRTAHDEAVAKAVAMLSDYRDEASEHQRPWLDVFAWTLALQSSEVDRAPIVAALRKIVGEAPGPEIVGEADEENAEEANAEVDQANADENDADDAEAAERRAKAEEALAEADTQRILHTALTSRAIAMLASFAIRPKAEPELVDFVRGWLEKTTEAPKASLAWRQFLYQYLLALDDKVRIEALLRKWSASAGDLPADATIEESDLTAPWRRELAMFLAENGKLPEAIGIFESLKADRTLPASDLLLLADLRLAEGDEEAWKTLRREAWELAEEYALSQTLQQTARAWQYDNSKPETLDEETLRQIDALFEKSSNPENYVHVVRDIYMASKDFRLLASLPRQVVGRTSGVAYAFAQAVADQLLPNVHEEATLNEMRRLIDEVRATKQGDDPQSVTDRRLLDLLLTAVEMRAQNVLNQPGPHVEKALAALKRASEKPCRADEAVAAATFLRSTFHYMTPRLDLQAEVLRQMEQTERAVGQTSEDRLRIAALRMQALDTSVADPAPVVSRRQQALQVGQAAFDDFRKAHPDEFPSSLEELLSIRMSLLENDKRYRESERLLEGVETLARKRRSDDWYETRLLSLWRNALYYGQEVSVGSGQALYVALRDAALKRIEDSSPRKLEERLGFLADVFTTASNRGIDVRLDVNRFVETKLDDVIAELPEAWANVIGRYGSVLETVFSPKRRLAFLLDRLQDYPALLAWEVDHRNRHFGDTIAYLRLQIDKSDKEELGELEEPTLAFMIEEIQREMRWRQSTQRSGWSRNYESTPGLFWVAKKNAFRDAALEVLAETPESEDATLYVVGYLHNDLSMTKDAIVVLEKAWRNGMTSTQVGELIVSYLRTDGREAEAIPYLLALIERTPSHMQYRKELIIAYSNAKRRDEANDAFDAAAKYLKEHDQRDEMSLATLGEAGIEVDRANEGLAMVEEAIRIRERNVAKVSSGDVQFSHYFDLLARGYLKQGEGRKAFDAAASAVVVWPNGHGEREYSLDVLRLVLKKMLGREKFLADWNAEVEETGKDSPLLRKELGRVLLEEGHAAEAAEQLELAAELGGIDPEVDRLRTEAYAAANDADNLRRAWIARVRNSPREYDLYLQFARTLEAGDPMIERSVTTTVELDPTEGGAHLALAGWRLEKGDLDAAERHYVRAQQLRTFDPAGWLGQAEVEIREKRWDDLKQTIKKLQETGWTNPPNDLAGQIEVLKAKLANRVQN